MLYLSKSNYLWNLRDDGGRYTTVPFVNLSFYEYVNFSCERSSLIEETTVLHKELLEFNLKRVLDPIDEPTLQLTPTGITLQTRKRKFDPRDKAIKDSCYCYFMSFSCRISIFHFLIKCG